MKKKLLLIGIGGHSRSCIDVIENTKEYEIVGYVEKNSKAAIQKTNLKLLGFDKDLPKIFNKIKYAHISVGQMKDLNLRKQLYYKLTKIGFNLPTIISKKSHVSKNNVKIRNNYRLKEATTKEFILFIHEYVHNFQQLTGFIKDSDFSITDIKYIIQEPDKPSMPRIYKNTSFIGFYYIQICSSNNLIINDPNIVKKMKTYNLLTSFTEDNIAINPSIGEIIIFPGYLYHYMINNTNKNIVMLTFSINI